jgi:putative CocE/NonD family hydrolase
MSTNRKYIKIPMFNVGGWYDIFNHGNISNFEYLQNQGAKGARGNQKLMMGPFGHGDLSGDLAYPGSDRLALGGDQEVRWFDYWLKGVDNGIMDEPPVRYFMMAGRQEGRLFAQEPACSPRPTGRRPTARCATTPPAARTCPPPRPPTAADGTKVS